VEGPLFPVKKGISMPCPYIPIHGAVGSGKRCTVDQGTLSRGQLERHSLWNRFWIRGPKVISLLFSPFPEVPCFLCPDNKCLGLMLLHNGWSVIAGLGKIPLGHSYCRSGNWFHSSSFLSSVQIFFYLIFCIFLFFRFIFSAEILQIKSYFTILFFPELVPGRVLSLRSAINGGTPRVSRHQRWNHFHSRVLTFQRLMVATRESLET
jgi:hypothetical protein